MLLSPLIALLPFLLNLNYWRGRGIWLGLFSSVLAGTAIGLVVALSFLGFYAALTCIKIKTGKFYQPPIIIQVLIGSFGAVTGMWFLSGIKNLISGESIQYPPFLPIIVFSGLIATAFSLYFAFQNAREESLALRAEAAEARYHVLENQMRPHFLFNALNSLAELIESGHGDAAETTYKLSNLYRRILANSNLKTASLESELEIVRDYLELEKLRYGSRLRFEIQAPKDCSEIYLPSLVIQTLVENAVKHGIAPMVEGGEVRIVVEPVDQAYRLTVINTGAQPVSGNNGGTGLSNTRARLDLLYGSTHKFSFCTDDLSRTNACFYFSGRRIE